MCQARFCPLDARTGTLYTPRRRLNRCRPRRELMLMPSVRPVADEAMRGREPERRVVRDLLRRAQRGTGGVVLVEGDPGSGKSLLLRDCVDEAARHGFSLAAGAAGPPARGGPPLALRAALGEAFATDRPDHDR